MAEQKKDERRGLAMSDRGIRPGQQHPGDPRKDEKGLAATQKKGVHQDPHPDWFRGCDD